MKMATIKEHEEANGEMTTLWGIGFDSESKEMTVDPIRDRRLTFRNPDELELFISGLKDCAQLWSKDDMSQDADFYGICQKPLTILKRYTGR